MGMLYGQVKKHTREVAGDIWKQLPPFHTAWGSAASTDNYLDKRELQFVAGGHW